MVVSSTSNLPLASRLASDSLRLQMSSAPIPFTAHRILSPVVTLRTAHGLLSNPNNAIRLFGWNLSVSRVSVGLQQKSRVPTALKSQKNDHEVRIFFNFFSSLNEIEPWICPNSISFFTVSVNFRTFLPGNFTNALLTLTVIVVLVLIHVLRTNLRRF